MFALQLLRIDFGCAIWRVW